MIVPEGPSLDLTVEVTLADGSQARWGPGAAAGDVPQGLSFGTKRGDGFADATINLSRRVDREWVDLNLYDEITITGGDGSVAYEGRVGAIPRSLQATHQISVQAAGYMAHARDRKFRMVYVDRDTSQWQDPPLNRRVALATGGIDAASITTSADSTGVAFSLPNQPLGAQTVAELFYIAPPGDVTLPTVEYAGSDTTVPAGYAAPGFSESATDDFAASTSVAATLDGTLRTATFTSPQRFLRTRLYSAGTAATPASGSQRRFTKLAVYGNHGVALQANTIGGDPHGVYASDVIRHIVGAYCPLLNADGVQDTTYPIPHLVYRDPTDPYDAFLDVNKYHLWDLAVWEDRTVHYTSTDLTDYDWEIRLDDPGVQLTWQGDTTDSQYNGVRVTYTDVVTGRTEEVTPDDHDELRDPDVGNPATLHGTDRWLELPLSVPTSQDGALQLGRAALAENNLPKAPGTINVVGHVRDRAGHWQQAWKMRAGDRVLVSDFADGGVRVIGETSYSHDSRTQTISVDAAMPRVDAVLDRLSTALSAAGLS
jgi:hypothetical protein